jgi:hypothetical protein
VTYHDLSECTLDGNERFHEKNEIMKIIIAAKIDPHRFSESEFNFILRMHHAARVSVKELFWLRDIKEKYCG